MPKNKTVKNNKCLVCKADIPKNRMGLSVTCKKDCSKTYLRIRYYISSNSNSKFISENKKLKLRIEELENAK